MAVLEVGKSGEPYSTISAALGAAVSGDEVVVHATLGASTIFLEPFTTVSGKTGIYIHPALGDEGKIRIQPSGAQASIWSWSGSTVPVWDDLIFEDPSGLLTGQFIALSGNSHSGKAHRCEFHVNGAGCAAFNAAFDGNGWQLWDCAFTGVAQVEYAWYSTFVSAAAFIDCTFDNFKMLVAGPCGMGFWRCRITNNSSTSNIIQAAQANFISVSCLFSGGHDAISVAANITGGIWNCTFYGQQSNGIYAGGFGDTVAAIKNNTFSNIVGYGLLFNASASPAPDYNHFFGCATGNSTGITAPTNSVFGDPLFTDAPADDFTFPPATSPLHDAGMDLSAIGIWGISTDIVGTARPQDLAWDIGAYEIAEVVWVGGASEVVETPSATSTAGWKKVTMGDALGLIPEVTESLEVVSGALTTTADVLKSASEAAEALAGLIASFSVTNYTEAFVFLVDQIKNEILNTGFKVLPYFEAPLKDYLYYLRTGTRLYEAKGHSNSYDAFMADLIGSFNDLGDEWRPITTGEVAMTAVMVAAPTLGELGSVYQELLGLFPDNEDLKLIIERILETTGIKLSTTATYSTPPDWYPTTLGSVFPVLKDFLDNLSNQIVSLLTPLAQAEDVVKELLELYTLKIARLLELAAEIAQYLAAFAGMMETGGYVLYAASTTGVKGLTQSIANISSLPEFKVDMYFGGLVILAEGVNVTSFKSLWAGAVPAGGINPVPEV